jgi:hypothetical protein
MTADAKSTSISAGDAAITGKEDEFAGSATTSELDVHTSSYGYREGVTFVSQGLRKDNYRPVDSYEGLHRYDLDFEWAPEEERKVVRRVRHFTASIRIYY